MSLDSKLSTEVFEEYSFADGTEYDLTCANQLREVITTVNSMGLALGRGDQSQQLSWSSGSATWSFEINFANGTEAPEWIQIQSSSQIVVKDDELDLGNYEFSLTGTPTEACY